MTSVETEQRSSSVGEEKVLTIVREMLGGGRGREDDEHPLKPGPWDPVIRKALERVLVFGPSPEPWRALLITLGSRFGEAVSLNSQPLPPRYAFLSAVAQTVGRHAEMLQEIADASRREGAQQGIIIVGGYTSRFADEWCGNGFTLNWPFPGPRPHWFTQELQGIDLIVIGAQLDQIARETFSPNLGQHFANASGRFLEAGLSKTL